MVSRLLLSLVSLFSVVVVWIHWNLFFNGISALGLNFSLFWLGFSFIIFTVDPGYRFRRDWVWLCPVVLIGLSYSLYENPWLKLISSFLLPIVIGVFCAYSHFRDAESLHWNNKLLWAICGRLMKPLSSTAKVIEALTQQSPTQNITTQASAGTIMRVLIGLIILMPLGAIVIVLLSSADPKFGVYVLGTLENLFDAISWVTVLKLVLSVLLTLVLLAIAIGWSGDLEFSEPPNNNTIDGVIAGIILGGLLVIYTAFLFAQLDNLTIDTLPENYREAEMMVKSGFWQLFLLALLNTGLFFTVYRKTGRTVQWVLRVFIIASSLLMVSAAWKVGLYSYTFGLSYEKFFACYTAVFALGVLLYLVIASFSVKYRNVVKAIMFAALWGYGVATISPIEKLIFYANIHLAEQNNTRISINQLTQLSLDIMPDVEKVSGTSLVLATGSESIRQWNRWRQVQTLRYCKRVWYEQNLSAVRACG